MIHQFPEIAAVMAEITKRLEKLEKENFEIKKKLSEKLPDRENAGSI